jgi:hypothetical protein
MLKHDLETEWQQSLYIFNNRGDLSFSAMRLKRITIILLEMRNDSSKVVEKIKAYI